MARTKGGATSGDRVLQAEGGVYSVTRMRAKLTVHRPLVNMPEDHPAFALLGRISAHWSQFEHVLDLIIWDLAGFPPVVLACLTGQLMGAGARFNCIFALAKLRGISDRLVKDAKRLQQSSYELSEERNRATHDAWFVEAETDSLGRFKKMGRKELEFGIKDVDTEALNAVIEQTKDLTNRAGNLRASFLAALAPSPDTQP